MKEFIEKLIGRLEEKAVEHRETGFEMERKGFSNIADKQYAKRTTYLNAIAIVNQLAKEYNNGWVLVEQNLPDEGKFYNVTIFDGENYRVEPAYYARIGYLWQKDIKAQWWTDFTSNAELIEDGEDKVIAWQPLPPVYQPKQNEVYKDV